MTDAPRTTTTATSGTSIRISSRQLAAASTTPDSSGASSGPSITIVPETPTAVARRPSGNMANASDVASGTINPAHNPCRMRAATSQPKFGETATATANRPKPATAARNTRRSPNRSADQPAVTWEIAVAIRNAVTAHSAPESTPRSSAITGRARTMNVVSISTTSEARAIAVIAAIG